MWAQEVLEVAFQFFFAEIYAVAAVCGFNSEECLTAVHLLDLHALVQQRLSLASEVGLQPFGICGTDDDIAYASASGAAKDLIGKCDALVANENFTWQQQPGGHDWPIWYLGIYNFAKIAFAK